MFLIPPNSFEIRQTEKKGRGVFTLSTIPKGTIIGDYLGKLMTYEEIDEADYPFLMYFDDTQGIVVDKKAVGVHLLNHSCEPNCTIYPFKGHTLLVAVHDIKPCEELTISYMYPPKDNCNDCTHQCYCGSKNCLKTMHTSEEKYRKWREYFEDEALKTKKELTIKNGNLQKLAFYPTSLHSNFLKDSCLCYTLSYG